MYFGRSSRWHEADCQSFPVQMVLSPSGRFKAEQSQEACSSTDRLRTTVAVGEVGHGDPIPAFVSSTGEALGSMSIGQRSIPLNLRWDGDTALTIVYPAGVSSALPAGPYGGVEVRLESRPAPSH
jgi:hypothetical protein